MMSTSKDLDDDCNDVIIEIPSKLRHKLSDARCRAEIAHAYEILSPILLEPRYNFSGRNRLSRERILHATGDHIIFLEQVLQTLLTEKAQRLNKISLNSGSDCSLEYYKQFFANLSNPKKEKTKCNNVLPPFENILSSCDHPQAISNEVENDQEKTACHRSLLVHDYHLPSTSSANLGKQNYNSNLTFIKEADNLPKLVNQMSTLHGSKKENYKRNCSSCKLKKNKNSTSYCPSWFCKSSSLKPIRKRNLYKSSLSNSFTPMVVTETSEKPENDFPNSAHAALFYTPEKKVKSSPGKINRFPISPMKYDILKFSPNTLTDIKTETISPILPLNADGNLIISTPDFTDEELQNFLANEVANFQFLDNSENDFSKSNPSVVSPLFGNQLKIPTPTSKERKKESHPKPFIACRRNLENEYLKVKEHTEESQQTENLDNIDIQDYDGYLMFHKKTVAQLETMMSPLLLGSQTVIDFTKEMWLQMPKDQQNAYNQMV